MTGAIRQLTFTVLLAQAFLSGCGSDDPLKSSKVGEQNIWRVYTVEHNHESRFATIVAKFKESGPTGRGVALDGDSKISVEDSALRLSGVSPKVVSEGQGGYTWTLSDARDLKSVDFIWVTPSNRPVRDRLNVPVPPAVSGLDSQLIRSKGGRVVLDRDAARTGEAITVYVSGLIEGSSTQAVVSQTITSGRYVDFSQLDLSRYALGKLSVAVEVSQRGESGSNSGVNAATLVGVTRSEPIQLDLSR